MRAGRKIYDPPYRPPHSSQLKQVDFNQNRVFPGCGKNFVKILEEASIN
jgi:hypothetical protein